MRYFYDWEFVERGPGNTTAPLSCGIVAEDGRELYQQFYDGLQPAVRNDWVRENVLPHLEKKFWTVEKVMYLHGTVQRLKLDTICPEYSDPVWVWYDETTRWRDTLYAFMDPEKFGKPELWGYYADYDHVLFAQSFGKMGDLPPDFPMYTNDLKQLSVMLGDPELPPLPDSREHHALDDAREIKFRFEFLVNRFFHQDLPGLRYYMGEALK